MGLTIISNFAADVAHRNLVMAERQVTASVARLSSGQRIFSAKDDAASLAIGSRLAAEVGAMRQVANNAGQAASLLQVADGALARGGDILTRMKALAVQASSGSLGSTERSIIDTEYQTLKAEIIRIGNDTEFNGVKLVSGSQSLTLAATYDATAGFDSARSSALTTGSAFSLTFTSSTTLSTFTYTDGADTYTATIDSSDTNIVTGGTGLAVPLSITLTSSNANLKGTVTLDLNTAFNPSVTIATATATVAGSSTTSFTFKVGTGAVAAEDDLTFTIDSLVAIAATLAANVQTQSGASVSSGQVTLAIDALTTARATVGANQSRLDFAVANVATAIENSEAARSQLLDLDVASEMTIFTSKQILLQTGVAMLAQANQIPQNLLRLFQ